MQQKKHYRVYQIRIKKGHRFFNYCDKMCFQSKNLYNTANFYARQVFFGLRKDKRHRQPLETKVLSIVEQYLPIMNKIKLSWVEKRKEKEAAKPEGQRKIIDDPVLFMMPTSDTPYVTYEMLDALFKVMKQPDYKILPSQVNQKVLKNVFANWSSFFTIMKDFRENPEKYKGRPKPPRYASKEGRKLVAFSYQVCRIKGKYLTFPKTSNRLNIGKLGLSNIKLQEVRIVPSYGEYVVEIVYDIGHPKEIGATPTRIIGIDLGINNFATLANNIGERPIVFKGKVLKSINHFYNNQRSYYYSLLRKNQSSKQWTLMSNRLLRLDRKRYYKVRDFMHKVSFRIVKQALEWNIDTIIIGKNSDFKKNNKVYQRDDQKFISLPYYLFISMMKYKAEYAGIHVIIQEEQYTSQANFLLNDPLPNESSTKPLPFRGKRIFRGLYQSACGRLINADVNAAANIIRKAVPKAFDRGNRGVVVSTPLAVSVH